MVFQPDPERIVWRVHLQSSPTAVYDALATDAGRASFWAESAVERDGIVEFEFINGEQYAGRVLAAEPPHRWAVEYFGSIVEFDLACDERGGTDVTMVDTGIPDAHRAEVTAGWLNVLLPLKAAVDFGVDLHSHDPTRTWDEGYVDH